MLVREIMTSPVQACSAQDPLDKAARLLWEHDCGLLPVVDRNGRVGATITDRDICMGAYTRGRRLADLRVADSMSKRILTCKPDDDLAVAVQSMAENQVRRLPVVDDERRLCGILSLNDLARAAPRSSMIGRLTLKALAAVSEPRPSRAEPSARTGAAHAGAGAIRE